MTDSQWEILKKACVIMCEGLKRAMEAFVAAAAAFETSACADALGVDLGRVWEDKWSEGYEELRRRIEEIVGTAALADDKEDILPPKKIPRPPRRTGPINKANYTANRPARKARSCCRKIKHCKSPKSCAVNDIV